VFGKSQLPWIATKALFYSCTQGYYYDKSHSLLYAKGKTDSGETNYEFTVQYETDEKSVLKKPVPPVLQMNGNIAAARTQPAGQIPYLLPPPYLPCRIKAVNYDRGGEGIAFHREHKGNDSVRNDGMNIRESTDIGGGYEIVSLFAGEWLEYSIFAPEAGEFTVNIRCVCESKRAGFSASFNAVNKTGTVTMENIGDGRWQTVTSAKVRLDKGEQVMQLRIESGELTLSAIELI
jgi:hypothetical protein